MGKFNAAKTGVVWCGGWAGAAMRALCRLLPAWLIIVGAVWLCMFLCRDRHANLRSR